MSPVANLAYVVLEAGGQLLKFDTSTYAQLASASIGPNARHVSISSDGAELSWDPWEPKPRTPNRSGRTAAEVPV